MTRYAKTIEKPPSANLRVLRASASIILPVLALGPMLTGCAHLGQRIEQVQVPEGAPSVEAILGGLAENEAHIDHFWAKGRFVLKTPELDAVYSLPQSSISFRRPADLFVEGRKYTAPVLRLTCSDEEFLIELPTEKQYLHRTRGEALPGVSFSVTPLDVAQEMFLPEGWDKLAPNRVRIEQFDAKENTAVLVVLSKGLRKQPIRRLWVQGVPWVVTRNERLDPKSGACVAETTKSDYRVEDGVRFPAVIESKFPEQNAEMRLELRSFDLTRTPEDADFDIGTKIKDLRTRDYQEVEYRAGEGQ